MINLKDLKNRVAKQRNTVLLALRRLKRDDPFATEDRSIIVEPGTDAAQLFGHEQTAVLEDKLRKDLKEIETALSKIKKGTYGVCERCKKPIEGARLEVKPQAIYCLKCEKEIEKGK
jgi:DnaK suppressor protein